MLRTKYDEKIKEWNGCDLPPVYNPKISLAQILLDTLMTYGSKIAQVLNKFHIKIDQIRKNK